MASIAQYLLFALVIATGIAYVAGALYPHGSHWAMQVCSQATMLCDHPQWVAVTAGIAGLVYFCVPRKES